MASAEGRTAVLFADLSRAFSTASDVAVQSCGSPPIELDRRIRHLLKEYFADPESEADWKRYAHFNTAHYVRNLVATEESFELIVSFPSASLVFR
jgi:hypothetical protein